MCIRKTNFRDWPTEYRNLLSSRFFATVDFFPIPIVLDAIARLLKYFLQDYFIYKKFSAERVIDVLVHMIQLYNIEHLL